MSTYLRIFFAISSMIVLFFTIIEDIATPISGLLWMVKALLLFPLVYPDEKDSACFKAGTG